MVEGNKVFYDPDSDPIVGRDSPGPKYSSLVVLGNPN